jgi:hypothetical protein
MSNENINTEVSTEFIKVIKDFIKDLIRTFPDKLNKESHEDLFILYENEDENDREKFDNIYKFCQQIYPKLFFDILYENEEMFINSVELLPNLDFSDLWKSDITNMTKSTIWKYLQLILFSSISNLNSDESFGDTAKLFEAIDKNEFKQKIEETLHNMENIFNKNEEVNKDISGNPEMNLPNAEDIHKHINQMMEGKLGRLAKEIAEETAEDLNIDVENTTSVDDVFKQLFQNPNKLMDLVKNVGSKLDNKIKSGAIKESELLEEASDLINKMKNMPGMNNLESMFAKMGMPKGKVDINGLNRQMQQNLRAAKTRERMRSKVQGKQQESTQGSTQESTQGSIQDLIQKSDKNNIVSKGINEQGIEEFVFSTGETIEKSAKPNKKKKKARGKKR